MASRSLWVLGALPSPVDPLRTLWSEAQATLPASFPLPPRAPELRSFFSRNVKMPKSLETLPSFSQKLFLLLPLQPSHKEGLGFVETKPVLALAVRVGRGTRRTPVVVISGLLWVAPSQSGQTHSEFLEGLLQPEEREPQLVRQEELIFNKERTIEPRAQQSCQLFPSSGVSTPGSGSPTECWKMARAY